MKFSRDSQLKAKTTGGKLTKQVLSGLFWSFGAKILNIFLRILILAIMARLLMPKDFGLISASLIVIGFVNILSNMGIPQSIIQKKDLTPAYIRTAFWLSILQSILISILIFFLAGQFAVLFRMPELKDVLMVMASLIIINGFMMIPRALIQKRLQFKKMAFVEVFSYFLGYGGVGVTMALRAYGVWALVFASIAQGVLAMGLYSYLQSFPKKPSMNILALKELIKNSITLSGGGLANYVAQQGDNFVVGRWLGTDALGFYGRAFSLMKMPTTLFGEVMNKVAFPALSSVQEEKIKLKIAFERGTAFVTLITFPSSVIAFVLAPEFIHVILGPKWTQVVAPFRVLAFGMLFRLAYKVPGTILRAKGKFALISGGQIMYGSLILSGAFIGKSHGITGVAVATLLGVFIFYAFLLYFCMIDLQYSLKNFLKLNLPGFRIAIMTLIIIIPTTILIRKANFNSLGFLISALFIIFLILLFLINFYPKLFLGREGKWWLENLNFLKERIL